MAARRTMRFGVMMAAVLIASACAPSVAEEQSRPAPGVTSALGAYLAGTVAARSGDFTAAADLLQQALAADPANQELLRRTLIATLGEGRFDEARALAHRVLEGEMDNPLANLFLAFDEAAEGRLEQADRRLTPLPRTGVNNLLIPLSRAWLAAGRGDLKAAEEQLKPLSELGQLSELYDFHRGLMAVVAKDRATADQAFAEVIAANPVPPLGVLELIGRHYEATGQLDKARALYDAFTARDPDGGYLDAPLARLRDGKPVTTVIAGPAEGLARGIFDISGLLQRDRNGGDLALVFTRLTLRLAPEFELAKLLLAEVLEAQGRTDQAVAVYAALPRTSPYSWDARQRVAIAKDTAGDTDGAVAELKALGAEYPTREGSLARAADLLRLRERFAEAIPLYDAAIARVPKLERQHWSLLFNRAIALERGGQVEKALAELQRTLTLEPDQPYVLNYLGYTWVDRGENIEEAKRLLERAMDLRPRDGAIVDSMGWVYYRLNDFPRAVQLLERAVVLKPGDPTINDHLGDAYWRVGRLIEARYQWERALKLNPEPQTIEPLQRKLKQGLDPVADNR